MSAARRETSTPWVLARGDQQPAWTLPRADSVGYVRGWFTRMEGTNFGAGLASIAFGQTTPLHSSAAEHIIYLLEGEVEFTIEGEPYPLLPGDMLFIPADAKYVYANVGRSQATFLSAISRTDAWPHEDTYFE
ncbi:MAG TPA: cupin domain-containing protein [Gaiellaceae bacterium]|nr:cupin domain-containing protein [Gaiellaceae bacterium]